MTITTEITFDRAATETGDVLTRTLPGRIDNFPVEKRRDGLYQVAVHNGFVAFDANTIQPIRTGEIERDQYREIISICPNYLRELITEYQTRIKNA